MIPKGLVRALLISALIVLAAAGSLRGAVTPSISESEALNELETIIDARDSSRLILVRKFISDSPSPAVRARAIGTAMLLHDEGALPLILERLARDRDRRVRRAAALALTEFPSVLAISPLIESATQDPDPLVRAACARAIGRQNNESAGRILISLLLGDESYEVRMEAAQSIGRLKLREGIEALKIAAERDREILVRLAAVRALQTFEDKNLFSFFRKEFEVAIDPDLRLELYRGMVALNGNRQVISLGLSDRDERIRFAALEKLIESISRRENEKLRDDTLHLLSDMLGDEFKGIRDLAKDVLLSRGYRVRDLGVRYELVE
ncbi:MAG: HEAT repeat domain-containing protein [Deltaproteobacteria bacterium]|nr:MAG: HEAT repeat domain-containing protein [Deltaproteobacteria bacterium]